MFGAGGGTGEGVVQVRRGHDANAMSMDQVLFGVQAVTQPRWWMSHERVVLQLQALEQAKGQVVRVAGSDEKSRRMARFVRNKSSEK